MKDYKYRLMIGTVVIAQAKTYKELEKYQKEWKHAETWIKQNPKEGKK